MNTASDFLSRLKDIVVFKQGNQRAPHKPLYLLYCIASLQQGLPRLQPYENIAERLAVALKRFAPRVATVHPEYPFWRLQNDGLAIVEVDGPLEYRPSNTDPKVSSLKKRKARGGLTEQDYRFLAGNLDAQSMALHLLLDGHFPKSIHEDVIRFFDLKFNDLHSTDIATESEFRECVLAAYDYKCALTGYSLSYDGTYPGLEAAHLCWPQVGGNDEIGNGIAMTTLHRKLFHLGLFTINSDHIIQVSSKVGDITASAINFSKFHGKTITLPRNASHVPHKGNLDWHAKWVFRG
jgi:putative restriction endonuclease